MQYQKLFPHGSFRHPCLILIPKNKTNHRDTLVYWVLNLGIVRMDLLIGS